MQIKNPPCYDISHWKEVADFSRVSPKPLLFITKATEGTGFVDSKFVRFFAGMASIGVRRGCFHFHRKAYQAVDQAAHFCNTVRARITEDDILILDVEEGGETAAQLKAWFEYVRGQFPNNQLMLYSRKNILDAIPLFMALMPNAISKPLDRLVYGMQPLNAIAMTLAEREFFKQIPTWTAGYPANPDLYASVPSFYVPDPAKWGPCWLWQYSDKGTVTGIEGSVDLNWIDPFFAAMLENGGTTPPPGGGMHYFEVRPNVSGEYRSIRASHPNSHIQGSKIGQIDPNSTGKALEKFVYSTAVAGYANAGDVWWKLHEANGLPIDGWSAEIHLGRRYLDVVEVGAPEPPVETLPDIHITSTGNAYYPPFDFTVNPK